MFLALAMIFGVAPQTSAATNHQNFESITLTSGKLLEDYSLSEYRRYYRKVNRRRFFGWRTHTVTSNVKVTYISETLFSYYNDGYTAIEYSFKLDRKVSSKLSLSATGSIGIKNTTTKQGFKNNLNGSLKLSADYTVSQDDRETYEIKLKVDPGTQVNLYIYGEGKLTNGVAARYVFWVRASRGGFEIFIVTTQYQRLEKIRI